MFTNTNDKSTANTNNNPTPGPFGNVAAGSDNKLAGGSLFGVSTGGLFSGGTASTGGGLFGNAGGSQLKTSERKYGGLFGNLPVSKPQGGYYAPKLTFGSLSTSTTPATGGLFGSNIAPKKYYSQGSASLFGNKSATTSNPLFSGSTPVGGGLFGNTTVQQTQGHASTTGGLFGNSTAITQTSNNCGLFSSTTTNVQLQQYSKLKYSTTPQPTTPFGQPGGLFSNINQEQKKEYPKQAAGLFSGSTPSGLFGGTTPVATPVATSGGLFGVSSGEKKEGGLFGSTTESKLFSKTPQSEGVSTVFGVATKKYEYNKSSYGGLFSSKATTPGAPLFPQPPTMTQSKYSAYTPKFSLTGRSSLSGTTPTFGSGLFNNNLQKQYEQKPKTTESTLVKSVEEKPKPIVSSSGLFGSVTPSATANQSTTQQPATIVSTVFGGNTQTSQGGLFSAQYKKLETTKPAETAGGLFGLGGQYKKETIPMLTPPSLSPGSLFGQKKEDITPKYPSTSGGLFQVSVGSLFSNNKPPAYQKPTYKQQSSTLFPDSTRTYDKKQSKPVISTTTQPKPQYSTSPTFFKSVTAEYKPILSSLFDSKKDESQQQQQYKSRTISFNEGLYSSKIGSGEKKVPDVVFGSTSGGDAGKGDYKSFNITESIIDIKKNDTLKGGVTTTTTTTTSTSKPSPSLFTQIPTQPKPSYQQYKVMTSFYVARLLTQEQIKKQQLKSIYYWLTISYTRSNEIPTQEMLAKKFQLHKNDDINKFLNDLFREVIIIVNLPLYYSSFKLMNKLFDELLYRLQIKYFLFKCTKIPVTQSDTITQTTTLYLVQLNNAYFLHHAIYKYTTYAYSLNLESQEVKKYISALTKKFISNNLEYLYFLYRKTYLLQLPYQLFYNLIKYSLGYNKLRTQSLPTSRQYQLTEIISLVYDFEKKIITKVSAILYLFVNDNFGSFQMINKQHLPELAKMLDNFSYTEEDVLIRTVLKVILNTIDLPNVTPQSPAINQQLKTAIKYTRSLQLLPIRTLLTCIYPNSSGSTSLSMISAHDLYHYIAGPEWIDWLEVYLGSGLGSGSFTMYRYISAIYAKYMLNILAYPKLKNKRILRYRLSLKETRYIYQLYKKILPRKKPICKFILTLKYYNMLDIFYLILYSLIYDYESYRRITETFFKQKEEFIYYFKVIVAEICNYPMQQFKEEIPFLEEKMSYFLRVCEVAPERIVEIEKMVFDGVKMIEGAKKGRDKLQQLKSYYVMNYRSWEIGHRMCHLIIDTINYFGLRYNQSIVAKCIACIKYLLSNYQTSKQMKLAMAVNKPYMSYLSLSPNISSTTMILSYKLTQEMMDLLEYFLVSEEFVYMLMTRLRSNNSEDVGLERYYAVRYSVKDYKVLLSEVGIGESSEASTVGEEEYVLKEKLSSSYNPYSYSQQQLQLTGPVQIIPSSYWLLKLLYTMVKSFHQQYNISSLLQKQLLYVVNLMLERVLSVITGYDNEITNYKTDTSNKVKMVDYQLCSSSTTPIYSLQSYSQQYSRVLVYIIEALNAVDIFTIIRYKLAYSITRAPQQQQYHKYQQKQSPYSIHNTLLFNNFEYQYLAIYLTVNVFRNIIQVYRQFESMRNNTMYKSRSKNVYNKLMYKLLAKMKWLYQLYQQVFVKGSPGYSFGGAVESNDDLVLGLVALLTTNCNDQQQSSYQSPSFASQSYSTTESQPINLKLSYEKQLVIPIIDNQLYLREKRKSLSSNNSGVSKIEKLYSMFRERINYQMAHDFMMVSRNGKYLETYESIECVVVGVLGLMIGNSQQYKIATFASSSSAYTYSLNLIKHLTLSYTTSPLSSTTWLLYTLSTQLQSLLFAYYSSTQLKYSILSLLESLINSPQSTTSSFIFAKKIFYQFVKMYQQHVGSTKRLSAGGYQLQMENKNRMNVIIIRTLNTLFEKDHYNFIRILPHYQLDILTTFILNNTYHIITSSQLVTKSLRQFSNKSMHNKEMTYYQLETAFEEREIVGVTDALEILVGCVSLVEKMFFDYYGVRNLSDYEGKRKVKYASVKVLSSLLIRTNVAYMAIDVWANGLATLKLDNYLRAYTIPTALSTINNNTNPPRAFTTNPLLHFITTSISIENTSHCFKLYKQNILNYLAQRALTLTIFSIRFLTWSLTIDNTLYGNQPTRKLPPTAQNINYHNKMSCSSHMGGYQMSAIEMFGENEIDAVVRVKELYELSLCKLSTMCGARDTLMRSVCFVDTITVMSYCLEWLWARQGTTDALSVLIRSTLSSSRTWLQHSTLSHPNIIKLVHSLSSISTTLQISPSQLSEIKLLITQLLSKYMQNRTLFMNESIIHYLLIILINFPITIEDSETISNIVTLWQNETNSQYFYSLSRLIVYYAIHVPGELARLKILTKCQKVNQLFNIQNANPIIPQCYHYGMRSQESISMTWIFKLASTMMSSSEESILLLQEVAEFYTMASKYIENLLKHVSTTGSASFVYLELLQTVMEFLLTLVTSSGWVAVHRAEFEKVTFLLSHKLVNVIVDLLGGKLLILPESEMYRRLRKYSSLTTTSNNISSQYLDSSSPYKLFSDHHTLTLLHLYTRLLSQSLYNSYYIHKHFNTAVYYNFRYGVSYWDRMNKTIGDMVKYGVNMKRRYQRLIYSKGFTSKINSLNDFTQCSYYFVESGYLATVTPMAYTPYYFIALINYMISTTLYLGNVHLIQYSSFRQRYQCLMKGNIQKFGNKLIDNAKVLYRVYYEYEKSGVRIDSMAKEKSYYEYSYKDYYEKVGKNLNSLVKNI